MWLKIIDNVLNSCYLYIIMTFKFNKYGRAYFDKKFPQEIQQIMDPDNIRLVRSPNVDNLNIAIRFEKMASLLNDKIEKLSQADYKKLGKAKITELFEKRAKFYELAAGHYLIAGNYLSGSICSSYAKEEYKKLKDELGVVRTSVLKLKILNREINSDQLVDTHRFEYASSIAGELGWLCLESTENNSVNSIEMHKLALSFYLISEKFHNAKISIENESKQDYTEIDRLDKIILIAEKFEMHDLIKEMNGKREKIRKQNDEISIKQTISRISKLEELINKVQNDQITYETHTKEEALMEFHLEILNRTLDVAEMGIQIELHIEKAKKAIEELKKLLPLLNNEERNEVDTILPDQLNRLEKLRK